jgi:hypothetical protein
LVFISKRKLFQKSFENVFEVLEKEKEKEIFSFSASGRKPSFPSLSLAQRALLLLDRAAGCAVGRPNLLLPQAAAPLLSFDSMTRRAHL